MLMAICSVSFLVLKRIEDKMSLVAVSRVDIEFCLKLFEEFEKDVVRIFRWGSDCLRSALG